MHSFGIYLQLVSLAGEMPQLDGYSDEQIVAYMDKREEYLYVVKTEFAELLKDCKGYVDVLKISKELEMLSKMHFGYTESSVAFKCLERTYTCINLMQAKKVPDQTRIGILNYPLLQVVKHG